MANYSRRRPEGPCPNADCDGNRFRFHGQVDRSIFFKLDEIVYKRWFCLSRWFCVKCGTTFRHYPSGVLPHKRYMLEDMMQACHSFLEGGDVTYATSARTGEIQWAHEGAVAEATHEEGAKEEERVIRVSGSTVFFWVSSLAGLLPGMRDRIDSEVIISMALARWEAAPHKARSEKRRGILKDAYLAIHGFWMRNTTDFKMSRGPP